MTQAAVVDDREQRWERAEAILNRSSDEDVAQGLRRRRNRVLGVLAAVYVLSTVLVGVVVVLLARRDDGPASAASVQADTGWLEIVGLIVMVIGFVAVMASIVQLVRVGQWGMMWKAPTSVLSRGQRRELGRQVKGLEPVVPERLPLARDLARRTTVSRPWALLAYLGALLLQFGGTLMSPSPWRFALTAGLVVLFAVAMATMERDYRRCRWFLDLNSSPASHG